MLAPVLSMFLCH